MAAGEAGLRRARGVQGGAARDAARPERAPQGTRAPAALVSLLRLGVGPQQAGGGVTRGSLGRGERPNCVINIVVVGK